MADSGVMRFTRRHRSGTPSLRLGAVGLAVLFAAGCSAEEPTAADLGLAEGPARLVLEPGDDPTEAAEQLAVPTPEPAAPDDPLGALASTEGLDDTEGAGDPETPSDDEEDAVDADPTAPSGDEGGDIEQPSEPADLDGVIAELIAFVEAERGHRFDPAPTVEALDAASFAAAVEEIIAVDTERFASELNEQTRVQRALGILTPDQDLAQIQASFGDAGLTALYDVNTRTVIVRDTTVTPLLRTSLVYELTRALDDQQFGIRRSDGVASVAEVEWARAALVHGSAAEIANRYRDTMSAAEVAEEEAEVAALPRNVSLSLFTDSFLELQFGRQFYGELAAAALWEQGQNAVDAAIADPPDSSEQLIAGADAGPAASIATPPADAAALADGVWGQAGWIALFTELMPPEEAEALTQGWGGDAWVAWEAGTASCVRLHLAADSPDALDRYADSLALWAENGDRQLFFPTADLIRVTACG